MEKLQNNQIVITPQKKPLQRAVITSSKKIVASPAPLPSQRSVLQNAGSSSLQLNLIPVQEKKRQYSIFNKEWEVTKGLGEGNTSKVYLCQSIKDPKKKMALKILREEFLTKDDQNIKQVEQEIQILDALRHKNVIDIYGYGSDGHILKPSGREIKRLVYIMTEYIPGGILFDFCQTMGQMGEDAGRFFMHQMIDVLMYMQGKGVVHRDLKLENILIDDKLNLKIADFGFATYKKIDTLKSYRGTLTYMAPEIKQGKTYNGKEIDIFSAGVILFIIVVGTFPFREAKKGEYFYQLLLKGDYQKYWKKVQAENTSKEFKDLAIKLFSFDGNNRPTIEELKQHPWMQIPYDIKSIRSSLLAKYIEKKSVCTSTSTKENKENIKN